MSLDGTERQERFVAVNELPYPLVSDPGGRIAGTFGVTRLGGWLPHRRVTFVIDKDGSIAHVIQSELNINRHVDEAIEALRQLQGT